MRNDTSGGCCFLRKAAQLKSWPQMLLAILLGNLFYFLLMPYLPDFLQHETFQVDAGLLVDFFICILIYQAVRRIRW